MHESARHVGDACDAATTHGLQPRRADHRLFHVPSSPPVKAKRGLHSPALLPHPHPPPSSPPRTFGASKTSGAKSPETKRKRRDLHAAAVLRAPGFGALRPFLVPPGSRPRLRDSPPAGSGGPQIQEAHSVPFPPRLSRQVEIGQGERERRVKSDVLSSLAEHRCEISF